MNDLSRVTELYEDLNTGDLLLWRLDNPLADTIVLLGPEQCKDLPEPVQHSSVLVALQGCSKKRLFTFEANEDGFKPHGLLNRLRTYKGRVYWCRLKEEHRGRIPSIEDEAFQHEGDTYNFLHLVQFAVHRPDIGPDTGICSEEVQKVVEGKDEGPVEAPGELLNDGYWEKPILILGG